MSGSLNEIKCKFSQLNHWKSLCKSLDKIKCIFKQNNSVLCEAIECENNDYLDMNFNIDLNLCKISHKMLSNHNLLTTKITKYYSTHSQQNTFKCLLKNCGKSYTNKKSLNNHKII